MGRIFKIIASFSMVCYLATSSAAATYALPMAVGSSDSPLSIESSQSSFGGLDETAGFTMPCHQDTDRLSSDIDTLNHCEMFCTAIGYVVLSPQIFNTSSLVGHCYHRCQDSHLVSIKLTVEQQPPK
jgi:hypothetical protein